MVRGTRGAVFKQLLLVWKVLEFSSGWKFRYIMYTRKRSYHGDNISKGKIHCVKSTNKIL